MTHWNNGQEALEELQKQIPPYIRSIGTFIFENKKCKLVKHYKSDTWSHCAVENHPIKEVYIVQSETGETFHIGNVCIDHLSNKKITDWFHNQQRREDQLSQAETQTKLDIYAGFLNAIETGDLPFNPLKTQHATLKDGYDRIINGKKLTHTHEETIIKLVKTLNTYYPNWTPFSNKTGKLLLNV